MMKWIGLAAAVTLIIACFLPWVRIPVGNLDITGMETAGTGFGKPGIIHIGLAIVYIAMLAINKVWCKRVNLFIIAFNTAWALRNFIIIPACHMGSCPEKYAGIYLTLVASLIMAGAALFVDLRIRRQ